MLKIQRGTIKFFFFFRTRLSFALTQAGKNSALGGAYFARALGYFYLVQIWGEVPLYTSSENATGGSPASVNAIYTQIEKDLKEAEQLLPDEYGAKTYPTKLVADALLSKVYLTWASAVDASGATVPASDANITFVSAKLLSAVTYADKVINSDKYTLEKDFLKIQPGRNNKNSVEHIYNIPYVLRKSGPNDGGNYQVHCAFSYGFGVNPDEAPTHIGLHRSTCGLNGMATTPTNCTTVAANFPTRLTCVALITKKPTNLRPKQGGCPYLEKASTAPNPATPTLALTNAIWIARKSVMPTCCSPKRKH
jgi:hypothetical protein